MNLILDDITNDDYDEEQDDVFTDDNEDFIEFKNDVNKWLLLDDDIITLQKAIKERKSKKNELTTKIQEYMNKF